MDMMDWISSWIIEVILKKQLYKQLFKKVFFTVLIFSLATTSFLSTYKNTVKLLPLPCIIKKRKGLEKEISKELRTIA